MVRKQKTYKEQETENTRGKKRYIERLIEDEEAAQRIEDFFTHPESDESEHEDKQANRPFS